MPVLKHICVPDADRPGYCKACGCGAYEPMHNLLGMPHAFQSFLGMAGSICRDCGRPESSPDHAKPEVV